MVGKGQGSAGRAWQLLRCWLLVVFLLLFPGERHGSLCAHSLYVTSFLQMKHIFPDSGKKKMTKRASGFTDSEVSGRKHVCRSILSIFTLLWYLLPNIPDLLSIILIPVQQSISAGRHVLYCTPDFGIKISESAFTWVCTGAKSQVAPLVSYIHRLSTVAEEIPHDHTQ